MRTVPLVRMGMLLPSIIFLDKLGTPIHKYLSRSNIPISVLNEPESLIALPMAIAFLAEAATSEGIDNLGIAIGLSASLSSAGMFGQLVSQALTLNEALQRVGQLSHSAMSASGDRIWLREEPQQIYFCQSFPNPRLFSHNYDHSIYYSLGLMLDCVRMALGEQWEPRIVTIPGKPYPNVRDSLRLGDTKLVYGAPHTSIEIPRHLLQTPISRRRTQTPKVLDTLHDWQQRAPRAYLVEALKQLLKTLFSDGYPTIEKSSMLMGTSVRTLQRELKKHDYSYSRVIDEVRYEVACELLQDPTIKIIDVAYELGYANPANFSHAFRRWTGVSPRKYLSEYQSEGINLKVS